MSRILSFPEGHPVAAYIFFLVFLSHPSFPLFFPSITCFRRQFLRKMWPIQWAFLFLLYVECTAAPWLTVTLPNFSHDRSNWSSPALCFKTSQVFLMHFPVSSSSTTQSYAPNVAIYCFLPWIAVQFAGEKSLLVKWCFCHVNPGLNFNACILHRLFKCYPNIWNSPHSAAVFDPSQSVLRTVCCLQILITLAFSTFISIPISVTLPLTPCSTSSSFLSGTIPSACFTVPITCSPILKCPEPSRPSV